MNTDKINELLVEELSNIGEAYGSTMGIMGAPFVKLTAKFTARAGRSGTSFSAKRLKTDQVTEYYKVAMTAVKLFDILKTYLSKNGRIIESSERKSLTALTLSGYANMNPCVLVVRLTIDSSNKINLEITGYAKEGIIKQNTCKKSINNLISFLNSNEVNVTHIKK